MHRAEKIQNYFEIMKTNIQYMVFKDPFNFFKKLSVHFRQRIADTHPSSTKFTVLCDKLCCAFSSHNGHSG